MTERQNQLSEAEIATAKNKHNSFLKELGLPLLT